MDRTLAVSRLPERIGEAQSAAGLSTRALSEKSGLATTTLRRKFADPGQFTLDELERLAAILHVDCVWLIFGEQQVVAA